jgi:Icc-related predicted phosphoesterase
MVRGVFTADQHGNIGQVVLAAEYARANNAILILGGDLTPHAQHTHMNAIQLQRDYLLKHLPRAIAPLEGKVYLLMGNEDCKCNRDVFDDPDVRYFWHDLHGKRWSLGKDLDIVGYSCVPCTPFVIKDWERVDYDQSLTRNSRKSGKVSHNGEWYPAVVPHTTIAEELAADAYIPNGKKTIFVSHCPPHDTLADAAKDNQHFGSKAIRAYI